MRTPLLLLISSILLAACGETTTDTPPATPAPARVLTEADKEAILATLPAPYGDGDLDNGRRAFARCRSCHTITPGGPNMTGPNLYGLFGREAGAHPGYPYSSALKQADFKWDAERLDHWLQNPRTFLPGNKMTFPGLAEATDRRDVIAFLKVETGYEPQPDPAS